MSDNRVYLDASFLAAISISNHHDFVKAQKRIAELKIEGAQFYTSPLAMDEMWLVVKRYKDEKEGNLRYLRSLNHYLKKVRLKILLHEINFSYKQVIDDLRRATSNILKLIEIIQLTGNLKSDIMGALKYIDDHNLRPRDSFHLAIMSSNGINQIVTKDSKLRRINIRGWSFIDY